MHAEARICIENLDSKLGGENVIVEIDESKFGKKEYNRGQKVDGVWVIGLVKRSKNRTVVFVPIEIRDRSTLKELVCKFVRPGSIIYSDCWRGYVDIKDFYEHKTVNHTEFYLDPATGVHTNTI